MESWMLGPPLLIGEKVFYTKHGFIVSGTVKWLGRLQEAFGNQMVAGLVLVRNIDKYIYIIVWLFLWKFCNSFIYVLDM